MILGQLGLFGLQIDVSLCHVALPEQRFVGIFLCLFHETYCFGGPIQTAQSEGFKLQNLREICFSVGQFECILLSLIEQRQHFLEAFLVAVTQCKRKRDAEIVRLHLEIFPVMLYRFGHLTLMHESICLHQEGIVVLRIDGERVVGSLDCLSHVVKSNTGLGQEVPGFGAIRLFFENRFEKCVSAFIVVEPHLYLGLHDGQTRVIGVVILELEQPILCQFPSVVVHKDGDTIVEIGVETVLHHRHLLEEEIGCLVCLSFLDEQLGPDIDDFLVILLGDAVDYVACFVEFTIKHSLSSQEDLRIYTVRMHIDGSLNGLISLGVLLARHVVFGNIRQLIRLHIRRLPLRDCLFIPMKQPEEMPRLIVLIAVFHLFI